MKSIAEIFDNSNQMIDSVCNFFHATEEQIDALICSFVERLPDAWKCRFQKPEPVRA